jgi:hypothetical protein
MDNHSFESVIYYGRALRPRKRPGRARTELEH